MDQNHQIVVVVEGGNVMSVFATFPAEYQIDVEILDFDNARTGADNPDALDEMQKRLGVVENEQRRIY